jgi:hypothetical protein
MVGSVLKGGLGNMMFQIAAAEAVSKKIGVDAVFIPRASGIIHKQVEEYAENIFSNVKFDENALYLNTYHEKTFSFNELPCFDHFLYDGYFQSELYFLEQRDHIMNLFSPTDIFMNEVIKKYPDISESCAIHVRRGDYLKFPDIHIAQGLDYYNRAINIIKGAGCKKFLVFSDDIYWCRENFKGEEFQIIEGNNDWEDLWIMSLCKHHIIANSTFSWWGAWLSKSPESIKVAPQKWFGPKGVQDTQDLYCKNWIRL